ncbi:virulence factor Mce family protein [[Mycobacterium] vasticus]|uniref:Virulence factor Mce family protein n=1 Tax=[Mycobacterium] vasticus TaxID=2875777 RepID=A0ABU5Z2N6_9MYCO|nr:virulence factor Mce family protein [Mycolicibacter sp. MYC017]MEB3071666.1 virulence factor Mce family protein [Mycolicibacter sp. MYC017]
MAIIFGVSGCGWRGLNSIPLPGTAGGGAGSFTIQVQLPDVTNIQQNSRVRVRDVTVGNVTKIERQGWHALVTMTLDRDTDLPANARAMVGQTSLLGSLHIELAPPTAVPAEGKLHEGSVIPLQASGSYPTTEQTLAALGMVLNGGGLGNVEDITEAFSTAFAGREDDLRSLMQQLDKFIGYVRDQTGDIIAATDSLNRLVGQFADQRPVIDKALKTIPDALAVLNSRREALVEAFDKLGKFSGLTADVLHKTKEHLVTELKDLGPVIESLANAGPDLVGSIEGLVVYPWNEKSIKNWVRGDYANLTAVFDLTLGRIDTGFFTGTRWEGDLTELELQWGRTIGMQPSPFTAGNPYTLGNPLVIPYIANQGS